MLKKVTNAIQYSLLHWINFQQTWDENWNLHALKSHFESMNFFFFDSNHDLCWVYQKCLQLPQTTFIYKATLTCTIMSHDHKIILLPLYAAEEPIPLITYNLFNE